MTRRAAGLALAALVALGAAGCGSSTPSPQDVAHDNGVKVGKAAKELTGAHTVNQVTAAVGDLDDAYTDVRKNVKDRSGTLSTQINNQFKVVSATLSDITHAASSADIAGVADGISELQTDIKTIAGQATTLSKQGNSVVKAFWSGVEEGYGDG